MRGPFLPAYLRGGMHWTEPLTTKLSESVKLVGATINCGGGYFHPDPQPHVQSYAVAMDAVSSQRPCHSPCLITSQGSWETKSKALVLQFYPLKFDICFMTRK